eukprot:s1422_g17.t1
MVAVKPVTPVTVPDVIRQAVRDFADDLHPGWPMVIVIICVVLAAQAARQILALLRNLEVATRQIQHLSSELARPQREKVSLQERSRLALEGIAPGGLVERIVKLVPLQAHFRACDKKNRSHDAVNNPSECQGKMT